MAIFRLQIDQRKAGSAAHGFQERAIVAQMLQRVANSMASAEHAGDITYDGEKIGSWSFGEGSHVHRERILGDGPGSAAARLTDPDEKERHDEANARQSLARAAMAR